MQIYNIELLYTPRYAYIHIHIMNRAIKIALQVTIIPPIMCKIVDVH